MRVCTFCEVRAPDPVNCPASNEWIVRGERQAGRPGLERRVRVVVLEADLGQEASADLPRRREAAVEAEVHSVGHRVALQGRARELRTLGDAELAERRSGCGGALLREIDGLHELDG